MISLSFAPLVPVPLIGILAATGIVLAVLWLRARGSVAVWRLVALAGLCLALLNPSLVREDRETVKSIVAVVTDRTGSQTIGDRSTMTDALREEIARQLAGKNDIEARFIDVPDAADDGGTRLFSALSSALADIPRSRIAGTIMITDGVIHDIPPSTDRFDLPGPLHVLVTGRPNERDRQVRFLATPKFGIVGKQLDIRAIVEEHGGTGTAKVSLRRNGQEIGKFDVPTGTPFTVQVLIEHGGGNVVELEVDPLPDELTTLNNRAVLSVEGIRDRLRVLLVSGQPHPGERAWRNLLKSDANVELVHFTILRPAEKTGNTPIDELSLIVFPIHDLFVNRLHDFDLVIFDRYANQGYIPAYYFNNIVNYLTQGGAVLVAAGPEYIDRSSLAFTPLGDHLPARPNGQVVERRFRPRITDIGQRHPVTRDIAGNGDALQWGEWFRIVGADAPQDKTLMSGPDGLPLLVLGTAEKGRVAILLSDQIWLWARGYGNGGPYLDFQRRLVHWLMKEPSLEEEALRAKAEGDVIHIERQSMKNDPGPVSLSMPDGSTRDITLRQEKPGLFSGSATSRQTGLHTLRSGELVSFVSIGPANPREFVDIFSSTKHVRGFAEATGGSVRRILNEAGDTPQIPRIDTGVGSSKLYGGNWIGFPDTHGTITRGVTITPAVTGFAALLLLAGLVLLTWLIEGRRKS